ncbi:hypothetical protein E2562_027628 [Oryza meyeriana var. granulata]|uniref:Uncharacterized protein n=1 Tax=Oryza meyeriana var. granulata TaxID=110450 RepID=A0A6G1E2U0_9ORYZ|nr:hypothetical protein E2562_027628 [Oryza meyeriana var. granulata]
MERNFLQTSIIQKTPKAPHHCSVEVAIIFVCRLILTKVAFSQGTIKEVTEKKRHTRIWRNNKLQLRFQHRKM